MAEFMQIRERTQRERNLRSPFEKYTDAELIRRYRFDRRGLRVICELVEDGFPRTNRGSTIPMETQVCAALAYLTSNIFQIHIGDTLGISQKSASRCVERFCLSFAAKAIQFIYMPTIHAKIVKEQPMFCGVARFPNVVVLIDKTHIHVQAPSQDVERDYVNRNNRHSISTQVVVNSINSQMWSPGIRGAHMTHIFFVQAFCGMPFRTTKLVVCFWAIQATRVKSG